MKLLITVWCGGKRHSCKVSIKRETTILPGTNIYSVKSWWISSCIYIKNIYNLKQFLDGVKEMNEKSKNKLNELIEEKNSLQLKKRIWIS